MTLEEFRRARDEMAYNHYMRRLPELDSEIARLESEVAPIWAEMREHFALHGLNKDGRYAEKQHVREKVYAQMDGRDWTLQRLIAERAAIKQELLVRWGVLVGEVVIEAGEILEAV